MLVVAAGIGVKEEAFLLIPPRLAIEVGTRVEDLNMDGYVTVMGE